MERFRPVLLQTIPLGLGELLPAHARSLLYQHLILYGLLSIKVFPNPPLDCVGGSHMGSPL